MKNIRQSWMKVAVAVTSVSAFTMGGGVFPAFAEETVTTEKPVHLVPADKYELAAAHTGIPVAELRQLEESGELLISEAGDIVVIDDVTEIEQLPALSAAADSPAADTFDIPGSPEAVRFQALR